MSQNEQLDILTALDEAAGFDEWFPSLPCPPWPLTTAELARRRGCDPAVMERVLQDEARRGNVDVDDDPKRCARRDCARPHNRQVLHAADEDGA